MWRARLDPDALLTQIEVLAQKQRAGKHPHALLGEALPLGALGHQAASFAHHLAATLARGEYVVGSVEPRRALIEGKWRTLYRAGALDMLVNATLAAELAPILESTFSDALYSYRRGRSTWQALHALVAYIEQHRAAHADVTQRGLYVIRRDVRSYGENIPVGAASRLWPMLEAAARPDSFTLSLLHDVMAPTLADSGERVTSVPTGSALQPLMCNLYLTPVDAIGVAVQDGFYARVGDDILFAHPNAQVAQTFVGDIERALNELRLALSASKSLDVYFTGAGRASDVWPQAKPTTHLQYLGARVDFRGGVGLKPDRVRQLLQRCRRRVVNTLALLGPGAQSERASLACQALRCAFDPSHPAADPIAPLLVGPVNDRHQLRQLDHWVALTVAECVTGTAGPRAFRKLPYRTLRREHGLPSLVVARQRRGRL